MHEWILAQGMHCGTRQASSTNIHDYTINGVRYPCTYIHHILISASYLTISLRGWRQVYGKSVLDPNETKLDSLRQRWDEMLSTSYDDIILRRMTLKNDQLPRANRRLQRSACQSWLRIQQLNRIAIKYSHYKRRRIISSNWRERPSSWDGCTSNRECLWWSLRPLLLDQPVQEHYQCLLQWWLARIEAVAWITIADMLYLWFQSS